MQNFTTTTQRPQAWVNPISAELDAYNLGAVDAINGEICCPEMYFISRVQMYLYCQGYATIRPGNFTATAIIAQYERAVVA